RQLRRLAGVLVALVAVVLIVQALRQPPPAAPRGASWALLVGIGMLAGAISGLLGSGGGLVVVPALALLLQTPQALAQGISLAVVLPASLSAALAHLKKGNVVSSLAVPLGLGAAIGAYSLGHAAPRTGDAALRALFGGLLFLA